MLKKLQTLNDVKKHDMSGSNKRAGYGVLIVLCCLSLVIVFTMNYQSAETAGRSTATRHQKTKQFPLEQAKFGAIGCADKMYLVEASAIATGIIRVSTDYFDDLWQRHGCRFLAENSKLTVLEREELATPAGTYQIVKVLIDDSTEGLLRYVFGEPIYVMQDDLRELEAIAAPFRRIDSDKPRK